MKYIPVFFRARYYYPITLAIVGVLAGVALTVFIMSDVISLEEYKMTLVSEERLRGEITGYYDLNNDGESEFLLFKSYGGRFPAMEYYADRDQFIDVIRPRGGWFNNIPSFCLGDYDQDSLKEIYMFTISNDSILLNAYEPLGNDGHFLVNMYIDQCGKVEGKNDIVVASPFFYDENGDGKLEFTFLLRAGFSLTPRRLYRLDIQNQKLERGLNTAAGLTKILPYDFDHDGKMEFMAIANAIKNFPAQDSSTPFNDNSAWLLGFDHDLKELMFANEYNSNKPFLSSCIREDEEGEYLLLLKYDQTIHQTFLMKYNFQGELLEEKQIFHDSYLRLMNEEGYDLKDIVITDYNHLYRYDDDLNLVEKIESIGIPYTWHDDFEFVKSTGFHLFQNDRKLVLVDSQLNGLGMLMLKYQIMSPELSLSLISKKSENSFRFSIRTDKDGEYIIDVSKRKFKHLEILFNILLYLVFYGLFYSIFRIQFYFFNRRLVTEQNIHTLQLQSVQNQLQPHFTFNVLNTIGSLIYKDEKDAAYKYLNHFSDMLRSTLVSRKQTDWMIDEEIEFIRTYVAMENLRFDNRFDFKLEISQDTDISYKVPKLMIQTFVENSISHGLMHKKDDCCLCLTINEDETHIIVVIKDNGIGRLAAGQLQRNNVGHGSRILKEYMEVYNRINKTKFKFTTTDLFAEDGKSGGTKVTLWIPRDYSGNNKTQ